MRVRTGEVERRQEDATASLRISTGREGVQHYDKSDDEAQDGDYQLQNYRGVVDLNERVAQVARALQDQNAIDVFDVNVLLGMRALFNVLLFVFAVLRFAVLLCFAVQFGLTADAQSVELEVRRCQRRTVIVLVVVFVQVLGVVATVVTWLNGATHVSWAMVAKAFLTQAVQLSAMLSAGGERIMRERDGLVGKSWQLVART